MPPRYAPFRTSLVSLGCRSHSVRNSSSAAEAAAKLVSDFAGQAITRRQLLDGNQLQKLSLTLGRRELHPGGDGGGGSLSVAADPPPPGTPLPPGYHLVYFTPDGVESELGSDGTDRTFNSPAPFTRRMWAGGRMRWANPLLRVGDVAEERTRLLSATPKRSRDGSEMVLVDVEKEFWGPEGLAVVDQRTLARSWIFRTELPAATEEVAAPVEVAVTRGPSVIEDEKTEGAAYPRRRFRWSPVGLFRFSALTFNGHKIHYDQPWSISIENHPGVVVHGPLNLINMLDYWRDALGGGAKLGEISYRALSPLYAGQTYHIQASDKVSAAKGSQWEILVERDGVLCMKGSIETKHPM
ncbi:hypothetical protein BX600DRAFT_538463 [Xylariales sp. PMI_506]|nr:hypothetical protein BX600DRAFT_538463 [Xylariales sp. PMI_506]